VIQSGDTFKLEILHANRDTLTFTETGGGDLLTKMPLAHAGDAVFSANIDGAAGGASDLSVTVNGRTITATSLTGASGLKVFFNGNADVDSLQMDFTTGFAARLYYTVDTMLAPNVGLIATNINSLSKQNTVRQDRADDMIARLDRQRDTLLRQYIAMEVALARAKTLRESLTTAFDAMFANQNN
jgi:flagellar capping protein FliD